MLRLRVGLRSAAGLGLRDMLRFTAGLPLALRPRKEGLRLADSRGESLR